MSATIVNGVIIDDTISKALIGLQEWYADALATGLDGAIGFLLENSNYLNGDDRELLNVLGTLHNAKTEILALVPHTEKGGGK